MAIELLNSEKIFELIEFANQNRLSTIKIFTTIDSTNTYLLKQAKLAAPSYTVCLAEQQTAGRGRLGRVWNSPEGNIYCSMLWRFAPTCKMAGLSLAVAVMVKNALQKYGINEGLQLKWPNDILFAHRKLAGILIEQNELSSVVIGMGINMQNLQNPAWIDVAEITQKSASRNLLAGLLINELLKNLPVFEKQGFEIFSKDWQQSSAFLNEKISVTTPTMTLSGNLRGVNENGELLLEDSEGNIRSFCVGEVSMRT